MNARNSSYNFQNVSNGVKSELLHLREQALMGFHGLRYQALIEILNRDT